MTESIEIVHRVARVDLGDLTMSRMMVYTRFWEILGAPGLPDGAAWRALSKGGFQVTCEYGSEADLTIVLASLVALDAPEEVQARATVLIATRAVAILP